MGVCTCVGEGVICSHYCVIVFILPPGISCVAGREKLTCGSDDTGGGGRSRCKLVGYILITACCVYTPSHTSQVHCGRKDGSDIKMLFGPSSHGICIYVGLEI